MRMLISLALLIFFGFISAYLAKQKGRDPIGWYLLGMLLGIFAPLVLLLLPAIPEKDRAGAQRETEEDEDRVLEGFVEQKPDHSYANREWFYLDDKRQQKGPVKFDLLKSIWRDGSLSAQSYIWAEGMLTWKKIGELPGFEEALEV